MYEEDCRCRKPPYLAEEVERNLFSTELNAQRNKKIHKVIRITTGDGPSMFYELREKYSDKFEEDFKNIVGFFQYHFDASTQVLTNLAKQFDGKALSKLSFMHFNHDIGMEITHFILKHVHNLEELRLTGALDLDAESIALVTQLPKLENLDIHHITGEQLALISQNMPALRSLTIYSNKLDINNIALTAQFAVLEKLIVTNSNINDDQLSTMLRGAPNLKILNIGACRSLTLDHLVNMEFPEILNELNLGDININADQLTRILQKLPHLKKLHCDNCKNLHSNHTIRLKLPEQLAELSISRSSVTDVQLVEILATTPNIRKLNISHCLFLGENKTPITASLSRLEKLVFCSLKTNTERQLASILQVAPNLKKLTINYYGIETLIKRAILNELVILELGHQRFSDREMLVLLRKTPKLNAVNILSCEIVDGHLTQNETDELNEYLNKIPDAFQNYQHRKELTAIDHGNQNTARASRVIVSEDQQKQRRPDENEKLDADTTINPNKEFHVKRIFLAQTGGLDPEVSSYRFKSYNDFKVNETLCNINEAFILKNTENLLLENPQVVVQESRGDLYSSLNLFQQQDDKAHYYGKISLQLDNQWQALPSLSPNEIMTHYHISQSISVEIQYSQRDSLYYIRTKNTGKIFVDMDFIIEIPNLFVRKSQEQSINSEIESLIQYCKNFKPAALKNIPENATGLDYLDALQTQQVGACRHRALILMHLMKKNHLAFPVRIINNTCHSFVEIKIDHAWMRYDLGGYEAKITINERIKSHIAASDLQEGKKEKKKKEAKVRTVDYFPLEKKSEKVPLKIFLQQLCNGEHSKSLLKAKGNVVINGLSYHLQSYCHNTGKSCFFVNEPDDLICASAYIKRNTFHGEMKEGPGGPLYRFLQENQHSEQAPIIIVNFKNFTTADMVRYNTLLDTTPSADGTSLPKHAVVIGLIDSLQPGIYQDASFYSRFAGQVSECPYTQTELVIPTPYTTESDTSSDAIINLHGAKNWKEILLGSWYLNGKELCFTEGLLIAALKSGRNKINIINPPIVDSDFDRFWQETLLKKQVICEGDIIQLPEGFSIKKRTNYDFSEDLKRITATSLENNKPPQDALVLNPELLANFFHQNYCDNATHTIRKAAGIFELFSNESISVYLSHTITLSEWSMFLSEAKKHQVQINLYITPHVTLPPEVKLSLPVMPTIVTPSFQAASLRHTHYVSSTDKDVTLENMRAVNSDAIVIDISEMNASHLLMLLDGKFDKTKKIFDFQEKKCILLRALAENKTVILQGVFKDELIHRLTPILLTRAYEQNQAGKLYFISNQNNPFLGLVNDAFHAVTSDEKKVLLQSCGDISRFNDQFIQQKSFTQLRAIQRHLRRQPGDDVRNTWAGLQSLTLMKKATSDFDLSDAQSQTQLFNRHRFQEVSKVLSIEPYVFLAGMTGVGKTSFVEKYYQDESQGRQLFRGEKELLKWAQDKTAGIKTLFIDEANVTAKQWSEFEGLFNKPPSITINGEHIELTKNHKVIFAGNPASYSSDRQVPLFFQRHGANSVIFEPLSPVYIYHEILKPQFENTRLTAQSAEIAIPILNVLQFLTDCSRDKILLTPREVTMMTQLTICYCTQHTESNPIFVAKYYAHLLARNFVPSNRLEEFDAQFKTQWIPERDLILPEDSRLIITKSNYPSAALLDDFLQLRHFRQDQPSLNSTQLIAGLGGFTIEGEPGLGKSELAIALLRKHGLQAANLEHKSDESTVFYHVPASMSLAKKEALLLHAFHTGAVVIWDEINCSASMEVLLNSLLMGKTPDGKEARKPGFLLIGTQNPTTMAGRRETSEALLHRMSYQVLSHYLTEEMIAMLQKIGLSKSHAEEMVDQYNEGRKTNKTLCFRDLIRMADDVCTGTIQAAEKLPMEEEALNAAFVAQGVTALVQPILPSLTQTLNNMFSMLFASQTLSILGTQARTESSSPALFQPRKNDDERISFLTTHIPTISKTRIMELNSDMRAELLDHTDQIIILINEIKIEFEKIVSLDLNSLADLLSNPLEDHESVRQFIDKHRSQSIYN